MLTFTGRNETIIVELKALFVFEWHFYHFFWGFPPLDFLQVPKMVPALAVNFILLFQQMLEEVSGTGMLSALLVFFLHRCHFL